MNRVSLLWVVALAVAAMACGGGLPKRYIVERDLGDYAYRRYQHVLDVEFNIEGNPAEGHTATYIRRSEGKAVSFVTAFVTVYKSPKGLSADVKDRLASLGTYDVGIRELGGANVWWLDGGGDRWALWVSGRHVVKLGAPEGKKSIPDDVVDAYLSLYPSDLDSHGRAFADAPSAGPAHGLESGDESDEAPMPKSLREGAPR
ncbi:MAG: hypothetical protein KC417_02140 [Myxococcales bacterium]|nr:hypothetical protein [Myxococcales bacterium]